MNANLNLRLYPLPASIVATLSRVDATVERFAAKGEAVPSVIGLSRSDFATVDTIVRRVSGNRADARRVTWNGRSLVPMAA